MGLMFGEDVRILRHAGGARRADGTWDRGAEVGEDVRCSSAPAKGDEAYIRRLVDQDAVRIESIRVFYVDFGVAVDADSDVIVREGVRYRAVAVAVYGSLKTVYGVREDPQ